MDTQQPSQQTINALFEATCQAHGERPFVGTAFKESLTYNEVAGQVENVAVYLASNGIKKSNRVAILAENSPGWGIAYLAIVRLGAVAVPILPDFPDSDIRHIIAESKAKIVFTTQRFLDKLSEIAHLPHIIITIDNSESSLTKTTSLKTVIAEGQTLPDEKRRRYLSAVSRVEEDDLTSIIYTSGTSGHSKAVMLTHRNFCSNVGAANQLIDLDHTWSFLSILPMSHAYEFTIGFLIPLSNGARIIYAGKPPTPNILGKICAHERPTALSVVPMIIEKIYKKRVKTSLSENRVLRFAARFAWSRRLIMQKIGAKLLQFFGGDLQLLAIGGAALNHETEQFLREANMPYLVGYGLTESSPLLSGGPFGDPTITLGSAGKPVPGVQIRIADEDPATGIGEIQAQGPNIMKGYMDNPEETAQTMTEDGWLKTGDLGFLDQQGNLHVTGRSKNVIVLPHGENIYPETIEEKINGFVQVAEVIVVENDGQLEARVYPDYEAIDAELSGSAEKKRQHIETLLKEIKTTVNADLPAYSKLHRVVERMEPFTKTATHKIKRYLYA